MRIDSLGWNNVDVLDRICEAYGFSQKIQLANHFDIASSSSLTDIPEALFRMTLRHTALLRQGPICSGYLQEKGNRSHLLRQPRTQ